MDEICFDVENDSVTIAKGITARFERFYEDLFFDQNCKEYRSGASIPFVLHTFEINGCVRYRCNLCDSSEHFHSIDEFYLHSETTIPHCAEM